jgi:hypothetical protein
MRRFIAQELPAMPRRRTFGPRVPAGRPAQAVALGRAAALVALSCAFGACRTGAPEGLEPELVREPTAEPSLVELNQRWQGVRCRLAEAIEVRRDAGHGWKSSAGILVPKSADGDAFYFRLLLTDRQTLDDLFDGNMLRAGTALVSEGWRFKDPEDSEGPYLELRFADRPAQARFEFRGVRQFGFDDFPRSRLAQVDDYCQRTLFKVSAPDAAEAAALPASPSPSPAPAAAVPSPAPAGPASPSRPEPVARPPARERPQLEIVRVVVAPNPVPRGGDAELIVEYSVGGLAAAASVVVLERREVTRAQEPILSTEDFYERPAATFTSSKPVRFSYEAASGSYVLKVTLEAGGARVERSAPFELR